MRKSIPFLIRLGRLGSVVRYLNGAQGNAAAEKGFGVFDLEIWPLMQAFNWFLEI